MVSAGILYSHVNGQMYYGRAAVHIGTILWYTKCQIRGKKKRTNLNGAGFVRRYYHVFLEPIFPCGILSLGAELFNSTKSLIHLFYRQCHTFI